MNQTEKDFLVTILGELEEGETVSAKDLIEKRLEEIENK